MDIITTDIYSYIYTTLVAKIQASVTDVKYIDIYDNQPNLPKQETGYDMPALFVEFKPVQWVQRAGGSRRATMQIDVHIETNREGTSKDSVTPQTQMPRGLYYLNLINQVYKALQGYNAGDIAVGFSSMVNVGDNLNNNADVTRTDVLSFQFEVLDNTNVPATATAPIRGQTIDVRRS